VLGVIKVQNKKISLTCTKLAIKFIRPEAKIGCYQTAGEEESKF